MILKWAAFIKYVFNTFSTFDPVDECETYKVEGCSHVDGINCNKECLFFNTVNTDNKID